MDDPTGLGKLAEGVAKLADSEVGIRAYDDLLADAMKEGGQALVDTIKAFRLFTAPIQLLALAQDRVAGFCARVRQRVPEERQIEAPPSVAAPVLMNLRYMEDDNPLTELYLNLLARAIDKERQSEAHPAFVKIIEQMSPDEAILVCILRDGNVWDTKMRDRPWVVTAVGGAESRFTDDLPLENFANPSWLPGYLEHLHALAIVSETGQKDIYALNDFGQLFVKACIPEDFKLERGTEEEDSAQGEPEAGA